MTDQKGAVKPAIEPEVVRLADYRPPDFIIDSVDLDFSLDEQTTRVVSRMTIRRYPQAKPDSPLVLMGRNLELVSVHLDEKRLGNDEYNTDEGSLTVFSVPDDFVLQVVTDIHPADNTSLGGLYTSGGNFCTQCEAEDFRKITYYLDRPDIMARFTTTMRADKTRYPVLLSNGNRVAGGEEDNGMHWARWEDPFPKPSYLFALVAGDLTCITDTFTTCSGRVVDLHIYVQHHNVDKCEHAMRSLKKAMAWDEQTYGREYDLDLYMIVAVDDFNMGAMENKGLNVFNSRYVLARPDTATDKDYQDIEGVIGHEYFHNWSGNRVTCRDWFQLSLKEGFTVFRDQEFSADMGSRGVKRVEDVNILRTHQFREDAGPMAHPVRPESYVEINNFYTVTVYNKGAEVVRMLAHLVGPDNFRKGTDLYFQRHDGQAVTTDDFVNAIEDASGMDLAQFRRWYSQAGTPLLSATQEYDENKQLYRLTITQSCPPTPQQSEKLPFQIPLALGLLDKSGKDLPLKLRGEDVAVEGTRVLDIKNAQEVFEFIQIPERPVPSLLRGFSAPVKVEMDLTDEDRLFLMSYDSDPFNRWEAGQQLAIKIIMGLVRDYQDDKPLKLDADYIEAIGRTLTDESLDKAMIAYALTLPSESYLAEFMTEIDPEAIHHARDFVRRSLSQALKDILLKVYEQNQDSGEYRIDSDAIASRALKNRCLVYLMALDDQQSRDICLRQFRTQQSMTDVMAALSCINDSHSEDREKVFEEFYQHWQGETLVVDKWLSLQARSSLQNTLERVIALTDHPSFTLRNPNKVRSLIGGFSMGNPLNFHRQDGSGYRFLTDYILELDKLNPQIAARLCNPYTQWKKYEPFRREQMKQQLERIMASKGLSKDCYEVVSKSLSA